MHWLFAVAAVLLGADSHVLALVDPEAPEPTSTPRLEISVARLELGEVLKGSELDGSIELRNTGEAPLLVSRARGSCGCLLVAGPRRIEPGQAASFDVRVDSRRLIPGKHSKRLTFETNDPDRPRYDVPVDWRVIGLIQTVSGGPVTLSGLHERPLDVTVKLVRGSDLAVAIEAAESLQGRFRVRSADTLDGGAQYRLRLLVPNSAKAMRTSDVLQLHVQCSDGRMRTTQLPVHIHLENRLVFRPSASVAFRKDHTRQLLTGKKVERRIVLEPSAPDIRARVTHWEVTGDTEPFGVRMIASRETEGQPPEWVFLISVDKYLDRKLARARIVIHTDDPSEPIKTIPLHAQFEPRK